MGIDYTDIFTTNEWFDSKDELLNWVRRVANENRMVVVVRRSDGGGGKRRARVYIGCENGGVYRDWKGKQNRFKWSEQSGENVVSDRDSKTRKSGCPFSLKGEEIQMGGPWALYVQTAVHNHLLPEYFEGHAYVQRFTAEEDDFVVRLMAQNVRPKDVMRQLKEKFSDNASSIKTLYNARHRHRLSDRAGRSQM